MAPSWDTGRRVLVVDHVKDTRDSLCVLLNYWGHQAVAAPDGLRALSAAAEFRPEVVFLDLGLPRMGGCEVASRLRQIPQTAASLVIALTGYADSAYLARARESGCDFCLVKPAEPEEMAQLVWSGRVGNQRRAG